MKKRLIPIVVLCLIFSLVPVTMGSFSDNPATKHWVYENFMVLSNAGLLQGYPDGSFRGNEDATRFEMVELTGRVLSLLEGKVQALNGEVKALDSEVKEHEGKKHLTEADVKAVLADMLKDSAQADAVYAALQNLEKEFKDELASLDTRVTTLNDEVAALKAEVETLKKANADKETQLASANEEIAKANKEAKTAKTMAIFGLIGAGVAGLLSVFLK